MRARVRFRDVDIDKIQCDELKEIAELYFIKEYSQLDIAFKLNYSEKTINRRIKEIKTRFKA